MNAYVPSCSSEMLYDHHKCGISSNATSSLIPSWSLKQSCSRALDGKVGFSVNWAWVMCLGRVFSQDSLLLCLFLLLACKPFGDIISASAYPWVEPRTGTQEICAHMATLQCSGLCHPYPKSHASGPWRLREQRTLCWALGLDKVWEMGMGWGSLNLRRQIFDLLNFRT